MSDAVPPVGRRQQIIDAAVELMHDSGFAGTSVRDIGNAVGLLSGSLYYYFREKEDILYDIQMILNDLIGAIPPAIEASGLDPVGRIRLFIELHLRMVEENLALCHVGYTEFRHLNPARVGEVQEPQRAYNAYLVGLIAQAQRTGDVRSDLDARTAAGAIVALLNSIIWWRQPNSRPDIDELTASYQTVLLDGLCPCPGEPARQRSRRSRAVG